MKDFTKLVLTTSIFLCIGNYTYADTTTATPSDAQKKEVPNEDYEKNLPSAEELLSIKKDDIFIGNINAPIKIIQYSSFTCPHCLDFEFTTIPKIEDLYVKNGKAVVVFRDFPLDYKSLKASMLGKCTGSNLGYRKAVFSALRADIRDNRAGNDLSSLKKIALMSNIGDIQYVKCMENATVMDRIIKEKYAAAKVLGIVATPTMFINGIKYEGARQFEELSVILDSLIPSTIQANMAARQEAAKTETELQEQAQKEGTIQPSAEPRKIMPQEQQNSSAPADTKNTKKVN